MTDGGSDGVVNAAAVGGGVGVATAGGGGCACSALRVAAAAEVEVAAAGLAFEEVPFPADFAASCTQHTTTFWTQCTTTDDDSQVALSLNAGLSAMDNGHSSPVSARLANFCPFGKQNSRAILNNLSTLPSDEKRNGGVFPVEEPSRVCTCTIGEVELIRILRSIGI